MSSNPIVQFFVQVVTLGGSYSWGRVFEYLFNPYILQGIGITILLSVLAQLFGSLIGLLLYFVRRSPVRVLRLLGSAYVLLFRGTPLLVQILFLSAFLPIVGLARPLIGIHLFQALGFTIAVPFDAFAAGLAALSLNEGAYMAEIVRAGIDSIDAGQVEAAKSLGMTYRLAMRRVVLPQAMRVIIPPLGNEFNSMLKSSSLVSVIAVSELLTMAQAFATALGSVLELLTVAALWYIVLTSIWSVIQLRIEHQLNASNREPSQRTAAPWWARALGRQPAWQPPAPIPGAPIPLGNDRGAR